MRLPSILRHALDRASGPSDEPLHFLRITAGALLLFGTVVAIGGAMAELRRLIDRHPGDRAVRRLRHALAELKAEHLESR